MQQFLLGRVGVLVLVHQDDVVGLALTVPDRAFGQQPRGDPDDLRVVVGRDGSQVEARRVAVEKPARGLPVVAPEPPSQPCQALAVQATFGRAEQEISQFGGEAAGLPPFGVRTREVEKVRELIAAEVVDDHELAARTHDPAKLIDSR